MANISNMAVQLTATAEGVQQGVDKATAILESGAAKIGDAASKAGDSVKQKMLPRIESALGKLPGIFAKDFTGAFEAISAKIKAWSESIGKWLQTSNVGTILRWSAAFAGFFGGTLPGLAKKGFAAVLSVVGDFNEKWQKAFKDPAKFVADLFGGVAGAIKQIPLVGGILALPFEAMQSGINFALDAYKEGADRIKELGASAAKTGISLQQFQVLGTALGGGELAEKALFKFQAQLANAALAAEGTRTDFDKLGLSGKDLADLAARDMPAAFGAVADKIKGLNNNALQAKMAMDLFGKTGFAIMPALLKGSEGIEKVKKNIDKFGLGISDSDFANVRQAGMAKKQLEMLKEGFNNQITIATAPFLAELAARLGELPGGFKGLADTIVSTMRQASEGIAFFVDSFGSWDTALDAVEASWQRVLASILEGIAEIVDTVPTVAGSFLEMIRSTAGSTAALEAFKALQGLGLADGGMADQLRKKAKASREASEEGFDALGLENAARGQNKALGAVNEFFDAIEKRRKKAQDDMKKFDIWGALLPRAQALEDALAGPVEKFRDKVEEVRQLMRAPQFAQLFPGVGERSLAKAFADLSGPGSKPQFGAALERGSKEAYSAILQYTQGRVPVEERIRQVLLEQKELQKEQVRVGKEVAEALKKINLDLKDL